MLKIEIKPRSQSQEAKVKAKPNQTRVALVSDWEDKGKVRWRHLPIVIQPPGGGHFLLTQIINLLPLPRASTSTTVHTAFHPIVQFGISPNLCGNINFPVECATIDQRSTVHCSAQVVLFLFLFLLLLIGSLADSTTVSAILSPRLSPDVVEPPVPPYKVVAAIYM